ncbi:MAG TPA: RNA methyltransferase [Gemmatimonadales bacterium]|jgi:TrmH family RNA methyltransferase
MGSNLLSLARDLHRRRARRRRRLALVEGWRLVEEALDAALAFRGVLVEGERERRPADAMILGRLADHAVPIDEVAASELADVCSTEAPQGILAIVEPPRWDLATLQPAPRQPVLVIDGVQDPGNVGALLRTAHALGAVGAILLPGTAELGNPRVVRGAMGSSFRFPTVQLSDDEFRSWVRRAGVLVLVTDPSGVPIERVARSTPLAVVVGNEGAGIRPGVRDIAGEIVAVPLAGGVESLNVAVAAGILLHEIRRA